MGKLFLCAMIFCCCTAIDVTAQKQKKYLVRDWVRDSLPVVNDTVTAYRQLDMIFAKALELNNGKTGAALFSGLRSTFSQYRFPLTVGVKLKFTSEDEKEFSQRVNKLPAGLFSNSKRDIDKLQHFFASAWLAYNFGSAVADVAGFSVEIAEEMLTVNNTFDEHDILANRLGHRFAEALFDGENILPGSFLQQWGRSIK